MSRDNKSQNEINETEINVTTFLSKNPQEYMIAELMKSKYGLKLMSESEWVKTLQALLNKEITQ